MIDKVLEYAHIWFVIMIVSTLSTGIFVAVPLIFYITLGKIPVIMYFIFHAIIFYMTYRETREKK